MRKSDRVGKSQRLELARRYGNRLPAMRLHRLVPRQRVLIGGRLVAGTNARLPARPQLRRPKGNRRFVHLDLAPVRIHLHHTPRILYLPRQRTAGFIPAGNIFSQQIRAPRDFGIVWNRLVGRFDLDGVIDRSRIAIWLDIDTPFI